MSLPAVDAALDGIRIRRFLSEHGEPLVDLPGRPIPDTADPLPVRFLPTWDATLLVHARRTLILPEHHRERIFHVKIPQSVGTFLVDGRVAGTWRQTTGSASSVRADAEPGRGAGNEEASLARSWPDTRGPQSRNDGPSELGDPIKG